MDNISKHISWNEATKTSSKYDNTPNPIQLGKMKLVAEKCFEPLREHFGQPIQINSFFRSKEVNFEMGGVKTSQHCLGEAIDFEGTEEMFVWAVNNLEYDQIINEFPDKNGTPSWIHISYSSTGNRKQVLKSVKRNGKTVYLKI